jgi:hypothetical protein
MVVVRVVRMVVVRGVRMVAVRIMRMVVVPQRTAAEDCRILVRGRSPSRIWLDCTWQMLVKREGHVEYI